MRVDKKIGEICVSDDDWGELAESDVEGVGKMPSVSFAPAASSAPASPLVDAASINEVSSEMAPASNETTPAKACETVTETTPVKNDKPTKCFFNTGLLGNCVERVVEPIQDVACVGNVAEPLESTSTLVFKEDIVPAQDGIQATPIAFAVGAAYDFENMLTGNLCESRARIPATSAAIGGLKQAVRQAKKTRQKKTKQSKHTAARKKNAGKSSAKKKFSPCNDWWWSKITNPLLSWAKSGQVRGYITASTSDHPKRRLVVEITEAQTPRYREILNHIFNTIQTQSMTKVEVLKIRSQML